MKTKACWCGVKVFPLPSFEPHIYKKPAEQSH